MNHSTLLLCAAVVACASPQAAQAEPKPRPLASMVLEAPRPMAVFVTGTDSRAAQAASAGTANRETGQPLSVDTPLRIASNTKPFVAATALRLWEQGRLDLDSAIAPLLTPALDALLRSDGYDPDRITVRQLLSHSSGLYDHGGDPRFTQTILAEPGRRWTREDLVRLSMDYGEPQSAPGTEFRYSDTGYILLGDIIERITGQDIAASVRTQLRLDSLGLRSTWWEIMEEPPATATPRARQWLGETDTTGVDASMDLYGGGGLVMSARDLATLTAALFNGQIFDRPETLREMLWQGPHRGAADYRLGIFVKPTSKGELYWHSGFWGTVVYYSPQLGRAAAGVTTHQDGFRPLVEIVEEAVVSPETHNVHPANRSGR